MQRLDLVPPRRDRRFCGVLQCIQSRTRLRAHAARKGHSLRIKTNKEPQGELHHTWPRAGSSSVRSKDLEALTLWYKVHHFHISQGPPAHPKPEGAQHEAVAMGRTTERLRVWNPISSGHGQCGCKCLEPKGILESPRKDTNPNYPFPPVFAYQRGLNRSLETQERHKWILARDG